MIKTLDRSPKDSINFSFRIDLNRIKQRFISNKILLESLMAWSSTTMVFASPSFSTRIGSIGLSYNVYGKNTP